MTQPEVTHLEWSHVYVAPIMNDESTNWRLVVAHDPTMNSIDSVTARIDNGDDRYDGDQGESDYVTTTETSVEAVTESSATTHQPVMLTRDMLRYLDSCSEYLRKFATLFPESRFPNGIAITQENCVRYNSRFDWQWARERMLTYDGQAELDRLAASRTAETHDRFGTGRTKRAAIFGYLIDQRPEFRSERLIEAQRLVKHTRDRNLIRAVERARHTIRDAKATIEHNQRILTETEASLPELERAAAPALRRVAESEVRDAERAAQIAADRATQLQRQLEEKRAELARFTALTASESQDESSVETIPELTKVSVTSNHSELVSAIERMNDNIRVNTPTFTLL